MWSDGRDALMVETTVGKKVAQWEGSAAAMWAWSWVAQTVAPLVGTANQTVGSMAMMMVREMDIIR